MKTKQVITNGIVSRYYGEEVVSLDNLNEEEMARWMCLVERN